MPVLRGRSRLHDNNRTFVAGATVVTDTTVDHVTLSGQGGQQLVVSQGTLAFYAQAYNAAGQALRGKTYTALSSDTDVATVAVDGTVLTVTGVHSGTANLTATCETVDSSARVVTVEDAMIASVALNNAQIKALPTAATYIEVVAAVGAGKAPVILGGFFTVDATAGAYTNVDATDTGSGPFLVVKAGATNTGVSWSGGAAAFSDAGQENGGTFAVGALLDATPPNKVVGASGALALFENGSIVVGFQNAALGNLTGGNAANAGAVTVVYVLVDV